MNKQRKTSNILNVFQYDETTGAVTLPSTLVLTAPTGTDNSTKVPSTAWVRTYVTGLSYLTGNQTLTISGDATGSGTTAITLTLANTAVTPGTYGSTTLVPVVTVDSKGRITSVTTAAISGSLTFTGDVTGSGTTGTSTAMTLAASGVTAGTYTKVTVDSKGRVTVGVSATTSDISEGTNLYYTDARVLSYLSANTYATQSYVNTQVSNLVAAAPATLDTLNELAAALGNDPSFATTISTALGNRLRVDINTQGLSATLQGYGRTNLGLGTAATSNTGDFVAYRTFGTAANSAVGDFVAYRTFGTAANNNTGDFALASHTHSIANVTGLQTALDGKQASGSYAASSHSHIISDVTGLQTALDGKQASLGFTPYNSTNPAGYITGVTNISGTAGSISGFNNPTTASTANTIVYRDASGDVAAREFVLTAATVHTVTPSSIVGIYPTTNQVVKFSASAIQTFLGLGSLAYSSATIPTNNNQLTNGAGYITSAGNAATATTATYASYLNTLGSYVWSSSSLPNTYHLGITSAFVGPTEGWQNYGSVMTMRTYSGGGGTLQLYTPYGPSNGGDSLQVRFGNYNVSTGNSWTGWKTLVDSGNIGSQSVSYASTAGALSSMNISQFTNNSGYITGYSETDTLSSVTGRGATTSTPITINGGGAQPLALTTANGSPWHIALVRNDLGLTSRVFANNSPYNGWYFEHNISIAGSTNWHSGNLTNLNQLSNGPGYITGLSFDGLSSKASGTGTYQTSGDFRAPIFYDSQDTSYYVDPNSTSQLNYLLTRRIKFIGEGSDSGMGQEAYAIYQEGGAWTHPYPDLRIAFHTGIKIGANASYQGIRFYDDYTMVNEVMSVNNASSPIGASHVYVNNVLQAGASLRAPIFYDSNDTGYYLDPNGNSVLTTALFNLNASSTLRLISAGTNASMIRAGAGDELYIGGNDTWQMRFSGGNVLMDNGGYLQNNESIRSPIFYDSNDTAYYLNPAGGSRLRNLYVGDSGDDWSDPGGWGTQIRFSNGPHVKFVLHARTPGIEAGMYVHTPGSVFIGSYTSHDVSLMYAGSRKMGFNASYIYTDVYLEAAGSLRAPIFYDSNDTGYYLDPNGTSNLQTWTVDTASRLGRSRYWTNRWATYGVANDHMTGTNGWGMDHGGWDTAWKGGFSGWDIWGTGTGHPQGGGYIHAQGIISGQHAAASDGSTAYGWMMVGAHNATENRYWLRGKWGGSTSGWVEMVTSGNIGSQSVSSATTATNLSGFDKTNPSFGAVYANNWFRAYGDSGLYLQDYGGHFRRNTNSSHGTFEIFGYAKGGYNGLLIKDDAGYFNNYMHEGGNGGLYCENQGGRWPWYWHRGNVCLGLGNSSTSSSYRVYVNGGLYAEGDIVAYSDARKKSEIVTIDGALDKVKQLRGVYYVRTDEVEKGRKTGVIAQEINEVLPEVVTYAADIDEYGVSYGNIVGVLIEAIKEQQLQIEELKNKLDNVLSSR